MAEHNIVMVHGLMGSLEFFNPSAYLPNLRVHTPDLIGYGARRGQIPESLAQQARFLLGYIETHVRRPCWLLGHSVGGAVAMLAASQKPEYVAGLISVEGNFTLEDAFWCGRIAGLSAEEWEREYHALQSDPAAWLAGSVPCVTPKRTGWAEAILFNQPASTIQAQAKAVIQDTGDDNYLQSVRKVVRQDTPLYLLAGERTHQDWHVPDWVADAARQYVVQPNTGHMMMLEEPAQFCAIVSKMVNNTSSPDKNGTATVTLPGGAP